MRVFVDTSAFVAVLDADDENHQKAKGKWEDLILKNVTLVCSNPSLTVKGGKLALDLFFEKRSSCFTRG